MSSHDRLREWLEASAELETAVLRAPPLREVDLDAAICALNHGGRLQYLVDVDRFGGVRLRVKVIERAGSCIWWLADSRGRVAPPLDAAALPA